MADETPNATNGEGTSTETNPNPPASDNNNNPPTGDNNNNPPAGDNNNNPSTDDTQSEKKSGLLDSILNFFKNDEEKDNESTDKPADEQQTQAQQAVNPFRNAKEAAMEFNDVVANQKCELELKEVVAPTTMAETAIHQMENLNISKLIGAPINAAVEAQFDAARKMLACVKEIGVKNDSLAVVTFNFMKNGKKAVMSVPLLTLVPITALRIKELTYAFKLKIDTGSSINVQTGAENTISYGTPGSTKEKSGGQGANTGGTQAGTKPGTDTNADNEKDGKDKKAELTPAAVDALKDSGKTESTFAATFSSKKDSKATQNSKYDVETTMDIAMTVTPDDQPAGISKMLEILNSTIDIHNPDGELFVDAKRTTLVNGVAIVTVTYINGEGIYAPGKIICKKMDDKEGKAKILAMNNGDKVDLLFIEPGVYMVSADKLQTPIVVDDEPVAKKTTSKDEEGNA